MVNKWLESAQYWLLPETCVICGGRGAQGVDVCGACKGELPLLGSSCLRCAEPLSSDELCGRCQQSPPHFDRAFAAFEYQDPIDHLIHDLKFNGKLHVARLLGIMMAERLSLSGVEMPDLLLPIPLHPHRLRERSFNQAVELGRFVAKQLDVPLLVDGCRRTQSTAPQVGKTAEERRRNLKGVFEVSVPIAGKRVALLDDVMTTGSTVDLLAKLLKQAGAAQVDVWVCARAANNS